MREILLDHVPFVSEADDEVVVAVMGVGLHDVPEDRTLTDLDHRFWLQVGLFADPCSETTCQNDDLHEIVSFLSCG